MRAVRTKDTSPEILVRRALFAAGVRGWRCHYKLVAGTPDLAWPALRVAVFVDGAFWHGHPSRHRPGRSGEYWDQKIAGNVTRDRAVDATLAATAWTVVRVWDFEIRRDLPGVVARIVAVLADHVAAGDSVSSAWQIALQRESVDPDPAAPDRRTVVNV